MMAISQLHIFAILALFPAFLHAPPLLRSFDFPKEVAARPPTIVAFLLFQMILTPMEAVVSIAMNAVSRHFEWEADRFAVELQDMLKEKAEDGKDEKLTGMEDMGERLGRALITLHVKNLSTVWVDWLCVFSFFTNLLVLTHLDILQVFGLSSLTSHSHRTIEGSRSFPGEEAEKGAVERTFKIVDLRALFCAGLSSELVFTPMQVED